ncbi:hypothetical protein KIPB_005827, partial [Kipferlia bialata]
GAVNLFDKDNKNGGTLRTLQGLDSGNEAVSGMVFDTFHRLLFACNGSSLCAWDVVDTQAHTPVVSKPLGACALSVSRLSSEDTQGEGEVTLLAGCGDGRVFVYSVEYTPAFHRATLSSSHPPITAAQSPIAKIRGPAAPHLGISIIVAQDTVNCVSQSSMMTNSITSALFGRTAPKSPSVTTKAKGGQTEDILQWDSRAEARRLTCERSMDETQAVSVLADLQRVTRDGDMASVNSDLVAQVQAIIDKEKRSVQRILSFFRQREARLDLSVPLLPPEMPTTQADQAQRQNVGGTDLGDVVFFLEQEMRATIVLGKKKMTSVDDAFSSLLATLIPGDTASGPDGITAILEPQVGLNALKDRQNHQIEALIAKQQAEVERMEQRHSEQISLFETSLPQQKRALAARYQTLLSLYRETRHREALILRNQLHRAILSYLPPRAIIGERWVILPHVQPYRNQLYSVYDMETAKICSARPVPSAFGKNAAFQRLFRSYQHPSLLRYVGDGVIPARKASDAVRHFVIVEAAPSLCLGSLIGDADKETEAGVAELPALLDTRTAAPRLQAERDSVKGMVKSILSALAYIQRDGKRQILRDLRPSCLLLPPSADPLVSLSHPVLFHLGIMRALDMDEQPEACTVYSAPEVVCGGISMTSDIWALGVILLRLMMAPADSSSSETHRGTPLCTPQEAEAPAPAAESDPEAPASHDIIVIDPLVERARSIITQQ